MTPCDTDTDRPFSCIAPPKDQAPWCSWLLSLGLILLGITLFYTVTMMTIYGPQETPGAVLSAPHWQYDWSFQVNAEGHYRLLYTNKHLPFDWWTRYDSTVYPTLDDAQHAIIDAERRLTRHRQHHSWFPGPKGEAP